MTLEQKTLLRKAMRELGMAIGYMKSFSFNETMTMLVCGYADLQKLADEVEMSGEDSKDDEEL